MVIFNSSVTVPEGIPIQILGVGRALCAPWPRRLPEGSHIDLGLRKASNLVTRSHYAC